MRIKELLRPDAARLINVLVASGQTGTWVHLGPIRCYSLECVARIYWDGRMYVSRVISEEE